MKRVRKALADFSQLVKEQEEQEQLSSEMAFGPSGFGFGSLLNDPFFSSPFREMDRMMQNMLGGDPFGHMQARQVRLEAGQVSGSPPFALRPFRPLNLALLAL